jgi:hypothetical protein
VVMSVFGRGVFQTRWSNIFDAAGSEVLELGEMRATTNPGNQADAENQKKSAGARSYANAFVWSKLVPDTLAKQNSWGWYSKLVGKAQNRDGTNRGHRTP